MPFLGCWEVDPHARPTFEVILARLDEISRSTFTQTPHDSFHTMRGHWKVEIEEKVNEIRMKENVSIEKAKGTYNTSFHFN